MPKQKTHRGAAKRFKLTAKGKVKRSHSMMNHILTKKSQKRKRKLRKQGDVTGPFRQDDQGDASRMIRWLRVEAPRGQERWHE